MQQLDTVVRRLDSSAMAARNTMNNSLLSVIHNTNTSDSRYVLSQYTTAFKQLESFYSVVDSQFSLCLCIPCKFAGRNSNRVPTLLSTAIPRECAGALSIPQSGQPSASELQMVAEIPRYNEGMARVHQSFVDTVAKARLKAKQQAQQRLQQQSREESSRKRAFEQQLVLANQQEQAQQARAVAAHPAAVEPGPDSPQAKRRKVGVIAR